jgi:hypothetical protein
MALVMKGCIFCDIIPCSPLIFNGVPGVITQETEFILGYILNMLWEA